MGALALILLLPLLKFGSLSAQNSTVEELLGAEVRVADVQNGTYQYSNLENSINRTLSPCDDFYSYVCDGWIQDHPIPRDRKNSDQMSTLEERIAMELQDEIESIELGQNREQTLLKVFYNRCMEKSNSTAEDAVDALFRRLRWLRENVFFLTDWLIEMTPEVAVYDISVYPDEFNSTLNIITVSPAGSMLPYATYFDPAYAAEYVANRKTLFEILNLLAMDDQMKDMMDYSPVGILRRVENFFTVDRNLAKTIEESKFQQGAMSIPITELSNYLPSVNWLRYFSHIFPSELVPSLPMRAVSLRDSYVILRIEEMVNRMPPRWFLDYLEWKVIFHYMPFFGKKYGKVLETYSKSLYGMERPDKKKSCVNLVVDNFSDVLSAIWVNKYFNQSSITKVMEMVDAVRGSFLTLLDENTWMDDKTKERARKKAYTIKPFIGYDPSYITPEKIRERYSLINYNEESCFYFICVALAKNKIWQNLKMLSRYNSKNTFDAVPVEVNAFYDPSQNQIAVLAGILQEPYFNPNWSDIMNYAGIGVVIGHEITHALDNEGSFYDEFGNRNDWWNPATREEFNHKKYCMEQQYGNIEVASGVMIDGPRTLGENIADNGGMRTVIRVIENRTMTSSIPGLEEYTAEQIFFLSYSYSWCSNERPFAILHDLASETHSPPKYRVNTVLANQPEFSSAFNCPLGSPMNPLKKCTVW